MDLAPTILSVEIVRYPSPSLRMAKVRLGWAAGLALVGFGAMLAARGMGYQLFLIGAINIGAALRLITPGFNALSGHLGEMKVDRALAGLGDEYRLLCNYCPEGKAGDADRVLFGPHGILLIEVKHYSPPVRVRGDAWSVQLSSGRWRKIASPAAQAKRCAKALEKEFGGRVAFVVAVPDGLRVDAVDSAAGIVRFGELAGFVCALRVWEAA